MLCDAQCEGDGATADVLCRRFIGWQDMPGQDVVGLEAAGQNNARSLIDTFADENESNAPQDDDSMKIAWRYAKLGRVQGADGTAPSAVNGQRTSTTSGTATTSFQKGASKRDYGRKVPTAATAAAAAPQIPAPVPETATAYCHTFDLQSSVSSRFIHASHNRIHQSSCPSYAELLARIQQLVDAQFSVSAGMTAPGGGPRPLLRIAIADLGSVDWIEEGEVCAGAFTVRFFAVIRRA